MKIMGVIAIASILPPLSGCSMFMSEEPKQQVIYNESEVPTTPLPPMLLDDDADK